MEADDTYNSFWNQSTYNDENKGAAEAEAIGGSGSAAANSAADKVTSGSIDANKTSKLDNLTSTAKSVSSLKNSIQNAITSKLLGTLFKDGSFVLPVEQLNNIKVNALSDGILNSLAKGLGVSSVFENGINNYFENQLSSLASDSGDTWSFLQKVGGKFQDNLKNAIDGIEVNKTYIPEVVYLAGLMKFKPIKSNINYKNKYIRKLCIQHDFALVLKFVDQESGVKYTVEKMSGCNEAIKAGMLGSWHVARYIMQQLNDEIKELQALYPMPTKYNRETDKLTKAKNDNIIKELENQLENIPSQNIAQIAALKELINQYKRKNDALFMNTEDEYKKDSNYNKVQTLIKKGRLQLHKIAKAIIVGSYSDFTIFHLKSLVKDFDLHPAAFGSMDKEFGKSCMISTSDLNVLAPIVKPKKENSLSGELNNLPKTNLTKSIGMKEFDIKYIKPRNQFCKKIYVYLQSTGIHDKKAMYNKPYKERMELPVYSLLLSSLDQAMSGFFDTGLGKRFVDTLNSIESAYYDYTISIEDKLWMPSRTTFFNFNDFTKIPSLDPEDYKEETVTTTSGTGTGASSGKSESGKTINQASGDTASTQVSSSDIQNSGKTTENGISVYYPKDFQPTNGTDAKGNTIVGYPSEAEVSEALAAGRIGEPSPSNPNGYPVSSSGSINPIIGYDNDGKAIYGSAIYYPTTKPIDETETGAPIFGYEMETKEITTSNVDDLSDEEVTYYLKKEYKYEDYQISELTNEQRRTLLKNKVEKQSFYIVIGNKPILGYDESGKPVYGPIETFSGTSEQYGYDITGRKILSYDDNRKPIVGVDKYGYPITGSSQLSPNGTTADGKTVYGYCKNKEGILVPVYGFSTTGKPLIVGLLGELEETDSYLRIPIGKTQEGYTIYAYDNLARPILGYDVNGNGILGYATVDGEVRCIINYDSNGNPLYSTPIVTMLAITKTIEVKIRTTSTSSSELSSLANSKSDWDLKTELDELEKEVMQEVITDYQPRVLKLVVA